MSIILSYSPRGRRARQYSELSRPRREMLMDHLYFRGEYVEYGLPLPMNGICEVSVDALDADPSKMSVGHKEK